LASAWILRAAVLIPGESQGPGLQFDSPEIGEGSEIAVSRDRPAELVLLCKDFAPHSGGRCTNCRQDFPIVRVSPMKGLVA
jgi:hypothetical protein